MNALPTDPWLLLDRTFPDGAVRKFKRDFVTPAEAIPREEPPAA